MNTNIHRDFQICISVPLNNKKELKSLQYKDVNQYSKIRILKLKCLRNQEIVFVNLLDKTEWFSIFLLKKVHLLC